MRALQHYREYDILKHPNVTLTTDGKAAPYQHSLDTLSIASISFDKNLLEQAEQLDVDDDRYELLSDEEIEEIYSKQGGNENEETHEA